uniref:Uncharacterized protein n=2 Tax=Lotharella globosa TaxID=91324 RepID=A0A7S3YXW2_9EUKA|mmetsp:Transcript_3897/g.7856  ORF Transcript_3897/g.7856 Transcript_3897/m.7856 type:complete len:482 (+) Transcript_3897:42-1487(+)|eukprot:CAMPEP_0167786898 /NCGR_PEP_ID=MMETSP0111_2-20121227/9089_1 /TAXON_ID=91324 /ORGANISM="Lotharella globosa, Strain CCCM811" /LENGTH=481 /DNA_ID=CAMNT_0007678413 /DNA_START=42 /DNA_END=1487 /DNA_ORIENTATION=-
MALVRFAVLLALAGARAAVAPRPAATSTLERTPLRTLARRPAALGRRPGLRRSAMENRDEQAPTAPLDAREKAPEATPAESLLQAASTKGGVGLDDAKGAKKAVRAALTEGTRVITSREGTIARNVLLAAAAAKLGLVDGKTAEAAYALGLIPLLQQVLDRTDIGSWNAMSSLVHRFSGAFMLALGPLVATYFTVSGEASLPSAIVYPVLLAALVNPLSGVLLVNRNLAQADMALLRQFATGYQGAVAAACHGLLLFSLPDNPLAIAAYLAFTMYHFVYAWGDSYLHTKRLVELQGEAATDRYDKSIALDQLPGGLQFPADVWDMWRRAPTTPGAGSPIENILWRALVHNTGEKEDRWTAAPSTVATAAVAWTVSLPATTYMLVALSYFAHGPEAVSQYVGGLDYNFQGILATMSLLASAQNNLGVFLMSLILHKKMPVPGVWALYGASWALFITYAASFATQHPTYLNDYLHFLSPFTPL